MTTTDDLRNSGYALLRLAEHIDRNAPGLLPDNTDAYFHKPSLVFRTDRADMLLSYAAVLPDLLPVGDGMYLSPAESPAPVSLFGPAPEPVQPEEAQHDHP